MNNFYYIQLIKYRFNRYMVECESTFLLIALILYRVLIDTWWNVNVSKPARYYTFDMF